MQLEDNKTCLCSRSERWLPITSSQPNPSFPSFDIDIKKLVGNKLDKLAFEVYIQIWSSLCSEIYTHARRQLSRSHKRCLLFDI